ncbi:RHS repeat protein [Serratia inhibens]|uniref:RHS repeat protein n=1 Tax=Serratia inhibens TaxID=2338073 RepID=A0AA92X4W9_9GAMM|nr:RHS repeat domain-containing protein [Serratia inhibens]RJF53337.1 RHS repeat protein [Serratia inhibens]
MSTVYSNTPEVRVYDNRGLSIRTIEYHRHPDSPDITQERITRHRHDARGFQAQSADPRMHEAGRMNLRYLTDLFGNVLHTDSADAGATLAFGDAAGRPFMSIINISHAGDGIWDLCKAITRTWQYEAPSLPGRPLSITETTAEGITRILDRFVYAGNSDTEKAQNLAGQCVSHYDAAGLQQTDSISLTGIPLYVTRRLLEGADNPDVVADWLGADTSAWNDLLTTESFTTLTASDATGAVLTTTDASGNMQRMAYNVAGQLSGSWLSLKGGKEQAIIRSVTWSAAGQKLQEVQGNGVVTSYTYEPETQRLIGIRVERPAGHTTGAKVLQDLRYEYDPVGNVLSITNDAEETRFWRNQKVVPENMYTYDSLYQLVSATGREMANAAQQGCGLPSATIHLPTDSTAFTNYTRTYTYDNGGNLTRIRHHAPATNNTYTTDITVSDRSNRGVLSSLATTPAAVDALFTAGGQQKQLQPGQQLVWTTRNELLKVSPVVREGNTDDRESYRYDSGSQRVLKVSTQKTGNSTQVQRAMYLPGLELRMTAAGSAEAENLQVITVGNAGRAQVRVLHWESGRPPGISNGQVRYSYDGLTGNSGLEVDKDGHVISMEEYYPYGGTAVWTARGRVEADYKTARYSGKERDATGLYYYGYRYYQPYSGRWLSADPAGTVDGLNLFRMVRNNPIRFRDIDGRLSVEELSIIGIAVIIFALSILNAMKGAKGIKNEEVAINPMIDKLKEYARSKIANEGLSESLVAPFERFIISEYESKYKNKSGFSIKILKCNDSVYAYVSPYEKAEEAERIIIEGVDVGRKLNKINASYLLLERAKNQTISESSSSARTDTSIFELKGSGVMKNKNISSHKPEKATERMIPSSNVSASTGGQRGFMIVNRARFDELNLNAIDRKILNKAIGDISEGKVGYKLENTNEYVVDLAGFRGQKGRGAFRLAFTQEQRTRTLTRIIDPH